MGQIANRVGGEAITGEADSALERRIFRVMIATVLAAAIISAFAAPWPFTLGLMLGGGLSLLNYHWLRRSVSAIFNIDHDTERPQIRISGYLLRYAAVGIVVFVAYQFRLVSLAATITGLCSFVPALFVEAFRQFYFAIVHREESF